MRHRPHRPSPAMVVALIALFVALGGTGYAAATGSIDSREIKNSSIQGTDVKDKSLTPKDFQGSVGDRPGATAPRVPPERRAYRAGRGRSEPRAIRATTGYGPGRRDQRGHTYGTQFAVTRNGFATVPPRATPENGRPVAV